MYDQLWVQTQCCKQELVTGTQRIAIVSHKYSSAGHSLDKVLTKHLSIATEQSFVQHQSWQ